MFSCSTCLRRAIRNLISDAPTTNRTSSRPRHHESLAFLYPQQSRAHSTIQAIRKGHHKQAIKKTFLDSQKNGVRLTNIKRRNGPLPGDVRDVLAREHNRRHLLIQEESVSSSTQFQLQWLQDPLKLANAVMDRLRIGADQDALELIRGSEKTGRVDGENKGRLVENVVSWNRIMEYYMYKGDIREALKVYNEMKKRGHRPEAYTYTILLTGFAKNVKKPNAVKDALSVYNSIFAPNSAVKPNTIHTNAVINVCARGGDMDSLWSVAGRLPERGPGTADNITYTSILNAIRTDAETRSRSLREGGTVHISVSDNIIENAIRDGEKLWMDVSKRWRAGNLKIDEPLTCAMGRLLLLGRNTATWNNIFLLVEQTMRIPRHRNMFRDDSSQSSGSQFGSVLIPAETSSWVASTDTSNPLEANQIEPTKNGETDNVMDSARVVNFEPVNARDNSLEKPQISVYAIPSPNTLSMVLQASILTRNLPAGKYYWDLLTSKDGKYAVQFDAENLAQYLRLLRVSRSSKATRDLICQDFTEHQASEFLMRGTFIIAMSTCVRDKNNPNVFDNATDIFEKMQERLPLLDAKVMDMYLEVAVVTTPGLGHKEGKFNPDPSKNDAMRVLSRFEPFIPEIKHMLTSKVREEQYEDLPNRRRKKLKDPREDSDRVYQKKADLSRLLQALVGVYHRLIAHRSLPESAREVYEVHRRRTDTFVKKMADEQSRQDRMKNYSERESGMLQLERQERETDERARGIKRPRKFHSNAGQGTTDFENPRRDRGQGSYQEGWGAGFALLAKHDSTRDFVSVGS